MVGALAHHNLGTRSAGRDRTPAPGALSGIRPLDEAMLRDVGNYKLGYGRSMEGIDKERVKQLLEQAFRKLLVEGYLDGADFRGVVVESGYKSVALVREIPGLPYDYLCKFATLPECQGNGVGRAVWELLNIEHPQFMWRASVANPICPWYEKKADGYVRYKDWYVYRRGITEERAAPHIELIGELPRTVVCPEKAKE